MAKLQKGDSDKFYEQDGSLLSTSKWKADVVRKMFIFSQDEKIGVKPWKAKEHLPSQKVFMSVKRLDRKRLRDDADPYAYADVPAAACRGPMGARRSEWGDLVDRMSCGVRPRARPQRVHPQGRNPRPARSPNRALMLPTPRCDLPTQPSPTVTGML